MSMAAGEYVSVHSQADTEHAELDLERAELKTDNSGEHKELAAIYVGRGLEPALAKQVADQLMAHDALGAHARDELGISPAFVPRPIQAALASAASFAVGAAMPLLVTAIAPEPALSRSWPGLHSPSSRFSVRWQRTRAAQRLQPVRPELPFGVHWQWRSQPAWERCSAPWFRSAIPPYGVGVFAYVLPRNENADRTAFAA
jgi:hypothetical protein